MSIRCVVGMAALLNCLLVAPVLAQQDAPSGSPKAGETKASADKPTGEQGAVKKQQKSKAIEEKLLLDRYGKHVRVREELIDSKGNKIPYTDVPLSKTFICYPPPEGSQPTSERPVNEVPKDYVCRPTHAEPDQVLRILSLTCPLPYFSCYIPNTPGHMACCCCK